MPTFNKHGEIDEQDDELQRQLRQKEVDPIYVPEKHVLRPTPPTRGSSQRMFPPVLLFVGAGGLLMLIVLGVIIGVMIGRNSAPPPVIAGALTTTVAPQTAVPTVEPITEVAASSTTDNAVAANVTTNTPTVDEPTTSPAAEPITATPTVALDPAAVTALAYTNGVGAYTAGRWGQAVELFQKVYQQDNTYLDIEEKLGAAYYNWSVELANRGEPADALDKLNAALTVDPSHELALAHQQRLMLYMDALSLRDQGSLREAAVKLEELRGLQADFLDSTALLYDTYLTYGGQLEKQRSDADARRIYTKAVELPVSDTSAAAAGLNRLKPPPTPTPKPSTAPKPPTAVPAVSKKLRFSVQNYNDDSRCISIGIRGIVPAGWFFVVDGIGLQGRFDGGGNARACGLAPGQEVTITVLDGNGTRVVGGGGVPSKGSAIMVAEWR